MSDNKFHERFERDMKARMTSDMVRSFSAEQIEAIKIAFGGASWDGHAVDLRGIIPFFRWYFALVAGPDRRGRKRAKSISDRPKQNLFARTMGAVTVMMFLILAAVLIFSAG